MNLTDPRFQDAEKAREWLEAQRWPQGPYCTHCGSFSVTGLRGTAHRPGVYQCNDCRQQFTVTTGSVMERSKIPLNKWLLAMHIMASSKKGYSAHQLHRTLGITYQSAWFLAHRIREAMGNDKASGPLAKARLSRLMKPISASRKTPSLQSSARAVRTSKAVALVLLASARLSRLSSAADAPRRSTLRPRPLPTSAT